MKRIHLICNAHLDPIWLWEWEEGAAAALSTFRTAADLCEEFDGFVFNHNEAILYQWIEEYEPLLFQRIQKLVAQGKWNIIGGWYLQPDCNMPSGESFIRQILYGRIYFKEKFGVIPTTAVNFDSPGHNRGLVQILKKCGYDSYIIMRPDKKESHIPMEEFNWIGYENSTIVVHRLSTGYNSQLGFAAKEVENWLKERKDPKNVSLITWGVGNHGGGPSREDIRNINQLANNVTDYDIVHSVPEKYFKELGESNCVLQDYNQDITPCHVGCYTSQIRLKQKHRLLENELFMVEKLLSAAAIQGYIKYPREELKKAFYKLLTAQFHDILPGASIQPVEEASIRLMDYGLEIASQLRARAFFALASGQEKAKEGEFPIMIYNPHPYKVVGVFECEFVIADQNLKDEFSLPVVYLNGEKIASQCEKEQSNLNFDWRKRVVFKAELEPSQMNRFNCKLEVLPTKPKPSLKEVEGNIVFVTEELTVIINCSTGLVDAYRINDVDFLKENSFHPLVLDDYDDSWSSTKYSFDKIIGRFELMTKEEGTNFSGISDKILNSVRVIEDGSVRSVVEAVFKYGNSFICQQYKLPKKGTELQVETRVFWNEKSKMLKLSIPTLLEEAKFIGQGAYGVGELQDNGLETVSQKWCGVVSRKENRIFTCINDGVYGSDFQGGELRISMLRSPAYAAADLSPFGVKDRPIVFGDCFIPRIDQGERLYNFWFNGGDIRERRENIDREALIHNEKPFVLSFFPSGDGIKPQPVVILRDKVIQMTAFKKAEIGDDYVIRLFEPTGETRTTIVELPYIGISREVVLTSFEIKTFRIDGINKILEEVSTMEETITTV